MIPSIFCLRKKRQGRSGLKSACFIPRQSRSRILMSLGTCKAEGNCAISFFIQNNLFCVAKIEISTKVTLHNCYDYWKWKTQSVVDWFNIWQARIKGVFPNSYALVGWFTQDASTVINVNRIILDYRVMTIWGIQNYWQCWWRWW